MAFRARTVHVHRVNDEQQKKGIVRLCFEFLIEHFEHLAIPFCRVNQIDLRKQS